MPIGHLLIGVRDLEQSRLVQMLADELHSNGHVVGESSRECYCRDASGVGRDDVNIREVHFERVAGLFAEFEGGGGAGRGKENVDRGKSRLKVPTKKRAHFLCLQVIRVVISGREGIRAKHDAALDFIPETCVSSLEIDVNNIFCALRNGETEARAVHAGKVGTGFGEEQQIVDG